MQNWDDRSIGKLGFSDNMGWFEVKAIGLSGGLLMIWNKDLINVQVIRSSRYWIWIEGVVEANLSPFACCNVYAPQNP